MFQLKPQNKAYQVYSQVSFLFYLQLKEPVRGLVLGRSISQSGQELVKELKKEIAFSAQAALSICSSPKPLLRERLQTSHNSSTCIINFHVIVTFSNQFLQYSLCKLCMLSNCLNMCYSQTLFKPTNKLDIIYTHIKIYFKLIPLFFNLMLLIFQVILNTHFSCRLEIYY